MQRSNEVFKPYSATLTGREERIERAAGKESPLNGPGRPIGVYHPLEPSQQEAEMAQWALLLRPE
jgi:hypothetical protein